MRLLLPALCFSAGILAQEPIAATTAGGQAVLLHPDGTWKYVETTAPTPKAASGHLKSKRATKEIKPPHGKFSVWVDPQKWKPKRQSDGRIMLTHKSKGAFGMIIAEPIGFPLSAFEQIALTNMESGGKDPRVVSREHRLVNGTEVLRLQLEVTVSGLPFVFSGYYFGGGIRINSAACMDSQESLDESPRGS